MSKRTGMPTVNAGSMADIAFLLLIFFLVTTVIEVDEGLDRMLPRINKDTAIMDRLKKNVLSIFLDSQGKLLVDDVLIEPDVLQQTAINFIDNGGALTSDKDFCGYCLGKRSSKSSDNPKKAVISITSNRETSYGAYISIQNEVIAAYNYLRNRESMRLFNMSLKDMESLYQKPNISFLVKLELREKINKIQLLYPLNIVDAEVITEKNN
ncbi:biopolymer transport protein ExbD/disulfide oxidoreductase YuzD [Saonia flava]|uniref:Biopolymer transport protein ExbD/disulfide oxidoreductase YuzD n=1 Tax=Saonia flava TaxID=523696 RepID=A0A846R2E8_9FLAO|nr:biopolymer transporter ExbD [Saonia flava]NJB70999.1 biopolymer transport protein ExbD/disulfide oxidoreductase YuzD [Saonia flava]